MSSSIQVVSRSSPSGSSPNNEKMTRRWPNEQTAIACALMVVNGTNTYAKATNIPLRALDSWIALKDKNYARVTFNVVGLSTVLLFPKGYLIAVAVDFISESLNAYRLHSKSLKIHKETPQLKSNYDPHKREDALKILDIDEKTAQDKQAIKEKYDSYVKNLEELKKNTSGLIAQNVQGMIEFGVTAYQTLTKDLPPN